MIVANVVIRKLGILVSSNGIITWFETLTNAHKAAPYRKNNFSL